MRLSEDTAFQQLLNALYTCAEHALPCLLQTIIKWYDTQHSSGALYPFRRAAIKTGARSQTLSAATSQEASTPASGGPELLIRSMLVEGSSTTTAGISDIAVSSQEVPNTVPTSSTTTSQDPPITVSWAAMSSLARENMAERRDVGLISFNFLPAILSVHMLIITYYAFLLFPFSKAVHRHSVLPDSDLSTETVALSPWS